ncbi:RNA-binding protein [Sphingomonas oleivorans]|uniref:RNA-binding protein n=1 Tax=Sphingomonas oleivorans TaxID=1735121 RepID=A0A2T5FX67_9SPHN|nr:RNA-binding S4 domain-containing protein [Sphingomonas oleivorans]PTQ10723.1 RNA-binding protein [Sphingomonas oleivorans]
MRLDKYLWFVRLAKTRTLAQQIAEAGHMRIDGRVIDRAHATVRIGNVLSFPLHGHVRVIRIEALPSRRGPASEAQACYTDLSPPLPKAQADPHLGPDVDVADGAP